MITRNCPNCGKTYEANPVRLKHGRQTTCSRKCSYELRGKNKQKPDVYICDNCKKEFIKRPFQMRAKTMTVCSSDCYNAIRSNGSKPFRTEKNSTCDTCGKSYTKRKRANRYCSRNCFEISHKKRMLNDGNPSYLDGRSKNRVCYRGDDWNDIRKSVYVRDNYTCQKCGTKCIGRKSMNSSNGHKVIQCHHIDPYKNSKSNAMSNLVTLCARCHRITENED